MPPILFRAGNVTHLSARSDMRRGVSPFFPAQMPLLAPQRLLISGVTKDSTGAVLSACTVTLFRTLDNQRLEVVTSDANGAYSFSTVGLSQQYYVVAYKAGAPDVAGTTRNDLVGLHG